MIGHKDTGDNGCPFYVRNKHDRGDDSMCRLFMMETKCLAVVTRQVCPKCGAVIILHDDELEEEKDG